MSSTKQELADYIGKYVSFVIGYALSHCACPGPSCKKITASLLHSISLAFSPTLILNIAIVKSGAIAYNVGY